MENVLNFVGSHGAVEANLPTHLSRTPSRWLYKAEYCQVSTSSIYPLPVYQTFMKAGIFLIWPSIFFRTRASQPLKRNEARLSCHADFEFHISSHPLAPNQKDIWLRERVRSSLLECKTALVCVCVCIRVWVWCVCAHKSGLGWTYLHMYEGCLSVKDVRVLEWQPNVWKHYHGCECVSVHVCVVRVFLSMDVWWMNVCERKSCWME